MLNISVNVQVESTTLTTSSDIPQEKEKEKEKEKILRVDEYYSRKTRQKHYAKTKKQDLKTRAKLEKYTLVLRRVINAKGLLKKIEIDIKPVKLAAVIRDIFDNVETLMLGRSDESPAISPDALFLAWDELEELEAKEKLKASPDHQLLDDLSITLAYLEKDHGTRRKQLQGLMSEGLITFELLCGLFKPHSALYTNKNTLREHQVLRERGSVWGYKEEDREEIKFLASKRAMIDPLAWAIHNHSYDILCRPEVLYNSRLQWVKDHDLIFCNHRVLGFSFEEKRWGAFAVSKLKEPRWNEAAFDKVRVPKGQPEPIKDLMCDHRMRSETGDSENPEDDDDDGIIKVKGKGLLGLLSSNPGVGKTLTAEAVAEVLHRPLYTVSAGDLGTCVGDVDEKLNQALDIIRRWDCVLLIDEADVFLHRRDNNVSLERNAIVSIFLRRLELVLSLYHLRDKGSTSLLFRDQRLTYSCEIMNRYFQGLAILTTNRMEDIDDAFMTRLHFKFEYKDLDSPTMVGIWKNFLAKEISRPGGHINEADLEQLAKEYMLSGREIKNAASCAKAISRARGQQLSLELVKDTIEKLSYAPEARCGRGRDGEGEAHCAKPKMRPEENVMVFEGGWVVIKANDEEENKGKGGKGGEGNAIEVMVDS
ncbi:hypothetical protein CDV36_002094 [Fusarium kuroshium]|uniref:AAA+ ATPase domain-containing protein n=1 Tax=Fusarium kuroshium TaxID=2010991 RepID=A0A3M2SL70_9HYPO|nr:hypothetical protein CDV36_002094 [Fusarium kuroshium]